jgi:regulator of sigma E protease
LLSILAAIPHFLLVSVLPVVVIISIIISFHEYGHYSVARLFKTRVDRFSVGFGKILLRHVDKRGTEWCLSAIPLGGYVKFAGDENIASMMPSREDLEAARASITAREGAEAVKDYFHFKPLWQRFLIILAGPVFNFILAIGIFSALFMTLGEPVGRPTITEVMPGSRAEAAGFHTGDVIKRVDGRTVDTGQDVVLQIALRADSTFPVEVERSHQIVKLQATPKRVVLPTGPSGDKATGGQLGIRLEDKLQYRHIGPLEAVGAGVAETWKTLDSNLTYIGRIFIGKENGGQIRGLVGMTKATGDKTAEAFQPNQPLWVNLISLLITELQMIAFISISIGFLNLLPIPVLDGGHLLFYLYQAVSGKPVSAGVQNIAFRIAVVLLVGLMLCVNGNDIRKQVEAAIQRHSQPQAQTQKVSPVQR